MDTEAFLEDLRKKLRESSNIIEKTKKVLSRKGKYTLVTFKWHNDRTYYAIYEGGDQLHISRKESYINGMWRKYKE